jgi:hypothetical protein
MGINGWSEYSSPVYVSPFVLFSLLTYYSHMYSSKREMSFSPQNPQRQHPPPPPYRDLAPERGPADVY